MSAELDALLGAVADTIYRWDLLKFLFRRRRRHWPNERARDRLAKHLAGHCYSVHPMCDGAFNVVCPDDTALADLADFHMVVVEPALDRLFSDLGPPHRLRYFHVGHLVQAHHGKQRQGGYANTSYSSGPEAARGLRYYADRAYKPTFGADPYVLHLEQVVQRAAAIARLGRWVPSGCVAHSGDLIGFDAQAFWDENERLFAIDFFRLGRIELNRRHGQRRPVENSPEEHAIGCSVFRHYGRRPNPEPQTPSHTVQWFLDHFDKGVQRDRFLVRLPVDHPTASRAHPRPDDGTFIFQQRATQLSDPPAFPIIASRQPAAPNTTMTQPIAQSHAC